MITFLIGVAILILGYFTYGKFVERVFGPDDRKTPALANPDAARLRHSQTRMALTASRCRTGKTFSFSF